MNSRSLFRPMLLLLGLLVLANTARADCTVPAGIAGDIIYSANYNVPAYCDGSSWITLAGSSGGGGSASPAGSLNDVQFNNGSTLGADTGNFTYSSGLLTTPNISTGNVSATTLNASGLGTLGSLLVAGGATVTGQASLTVISTSLIQVGNNGAACTSNLAGGVRYNSTSNTIDYCTGTAWMSMGPSSTQPVSWSVNKSSAQTFTSANAWNRVTGWTTNFDTNNNFASDKFTVTVPGKYLVTANIRINLASAGTYGTAIYKNGAYYRAVIGANPSASPSNGSPVTAIINAVAGDYFEVYEWSSTATNTVYNTDTGSNYFSGVLLSPQGSGAGTATPAGSTADVQFNYAGALAADTGIFTYASGVLAAPSVSATSISTTVANVASVSTVANVVGGSGNIIASGSAVVSTSSAGSITIFTNGAPRLVVDASGHVGIGTSAPAATLDVNGYLSVGNGIKSTKADTTGQPSFFIVTNSAGQSLDLRFTEDAISSIPVNTWQFRSGGLSQNITFSGYDSRPVIYMDVTNQRLGVVTTTPAYPLDVTGDIRTSSCLRYSASTLGSCTSDARIKRDITPYTAGLSELLGLQPKTFFYNGLGGNPDDGRKQIGLVAQDVEKVAPELVSTTLAKLHPNDDSPTAIKTVNYSALAYMSINAIKELKADNDNLHATLNDANASISALKALIDLQGREIQSLKKSLTK